MKKVTLFLLLLCFSLALSAQVINQSAAWPNTNWTVTGVYNADPTAFEADPTLTSNFAFDDDDAGGASDDDIAAESPVIDLSAAFAAGETWLFIDVDYTYNDLGDTLNLEYWDADTSTWVAWQQFVATADQPTDNFCNGARDSFTSNQLNIAGFTATQLSGFQYRIAFYDDGPGGGAGWEWGFCFDAPTLTSQTPPSCPDPSALDVANVLETTVDLLWTESGSATVWNIEWGPAGFTPGTGTLITGVTTNPYNLGGLTAGTSYDFYVQSDCDGTGTSNLVGPFNFISATPGGTCANAFSMTVESDCATATPVTFDFSVAEDINANGENPSCDGFGNFGYWVSFTAPPIGSVIFNFSGAADNIGLEVFDACGGTAVSACTNNTLDTGDDSGIIGGLTPGNTYVAVLWRDGQTGTADVCIEEGPSCTFPVNLAATNETLDGAELSWTENGTATVWNIEIVPSGDAPTGVPTVTGVTNPYTVTGLAASTSYDFYVQADCGGSDTSDFNGPGTFTTLCDVFIPDYQENFTNIVPNCWNEAGDGDATTGPIGLGAGDWADGGYLNNGFTGAYKINLWQAFKSDWILSPQFDLTGGPFQVEFDFGIMQFGSSVNPGVLGSDDTVQLLISTDNGATWTSLLTYDSTSVVPVTGEHPVVDLTAYSGQIVQFGILGSEGTVDDTADNDIFVDNFQVRAIPTCPEPSDLTATNLSLTSTEVGWTENGTSSVWNVEYGVAGFALGTGTVDANVTNPHTLTGLTPDTSYEFYVQAVCGPGDFSSWTGPFEFFTGYCASIPTSNDGQGVTNVTIGVTDFPSLGDVTYENQTSPVVNVFQGVETNLIIDFATGFTYDVNIWIDFNDDLVFDDTELVFQGETTNDNPTTFDASFVMPLTAPLGEHRMRIGSADFGQDPPNPCFNGSFGVTLDFTVNIEQLNCTLAEATYTTAPDCDNDQFFIDVDITSLGDATSLEISNNFDANTSQATATGTYQAGPFPFGSSVKVFVTNEQDNNCVISSEFFTVLACPPDNDECDMATIAVVNDGETCDLLTSGTILAATPSGVDAGSCAGNPDDDVWFEFTALSEVQIISILNIAGGTFNIDHALYEGSCGALTELYCSPNESSVTPSLTIGNTYYLRIFSGGSQPETTTFDLCIREAPTNIICENAENFCSVGGALVSSNIIGIPDPSDIACLSSAPNPTWNIIQIGDSGLIEIEIAQTDAAGGGLDVDFVLWGPFTSVEGVCDSLDNGCPTPGDCPNNTTSPDFYPFGNIVDCSYSVVSTENLTIDNAQTGEVYLLLVTNFSDDPGIITITQTNAGTTGSGTIEAEISAELVSNDVFIDPNNDPNEIDEVSVCGFDQVTIETNSPFADSYIWFEDGFEITGETSSTLTVPNGGFGFGATNYQVQAFDEQCGAQATSQIVIINLYDDPGTVNPQNITVCDGPEGDGAEDFDLDALTASLGFGADFTVSYYTNTADANQAINAVASPYNSSGETLIIRVEDADAATAGFLGCRQLADLELVVTARPVINQPADFVVCDDLDGTVDGITEFDLTSIDPEVSTDPDVVITYHTSQADADNGAGALTSPYSSSGETIFVRAENTASNCYDTTSFNLVVNVVPLATFDPQFDYAVCPNATVPVSIGIVPSNFTEADVTITWFLDGSPIAGSNGLTLDTVLVQGDYSAEISFNATGCVNTISTTVAELDACIFPEGISPGVTPGQNDRFDLSSFNVTKLEIFNRNGTLVYSKKNYTDEWVGQTNDGEELPVGTYFYTVIYDGGNKKRSAWVYINR
jgi:hypothetical protein